MSTPKEPLADALNAVVDVIITRMEARGGGLYFTCLVDRDGTMRVASNIPPEHVRALLREMDKTVVDRMKHESGAPREAAS